MTRPDVSPLPDSGYGYLLRHRGVIPAAKHRPPISGRLTPHRIRLAPYMTWLVQSKQSRATVVNRILKQGGLHEKRFLRVRAGTGFVGRLRRGTNDGDNDDNYAGSHHDGPGHAACHARGPCDPGSASGSD